MWCLIVLIPDLCHLSYFYNYGILFYLHDDQALDAMTTLTLSFYPLVWYRQQHDINIVLTTVICTPPVFSHLPVKLTEPEVTFSVNNIKFKYQYMEIQTQYIMHNTLHFKGIQE